MGGRRQINWRREEPLKTTVVRLIFVQFSDGFRMEHILATDEHRLTSIIFKSEHFHHRGTETQRKANRLNHQDTKGTKKGF